MWNNALCAKKEGAYEQTESAEVGGCVWDSWQHLAHSHVPALLSIRPCSRIEVEKRWQDISQEPLSQG
jgi:hypothetical protein